MPGTLLSWVLLQMSGTFHKQSVSFFGHATDNTSKCSGLLTLSVFCRSAASSSLLNQMTVAAILWMEKCYANRVIWAWFPVKGTTTKRWEILHIDAFKYFKSPECPNFPPAKTDCKLPFLLLRSSSSSFILDNFALHKLNKTNSCIYAKANLSFL